MKPLSRRTVLRGMFGGVAVSLGLPLLDRFLDDNGTALAQGAPLPVRFGTWFWGCGINPDRWAPTIEGPDYDLPPELQPLADVRSEINVFSGFNTILDGYANWPHTTGVAATLCGAVAEADGQFPATTLDVLIAQEIGQATRFRSLEMAATGVPAQSYSRPNPTSTNTSTVSPLEMYSRLFGEGFVDPGSSQTGPDPRLLLRQSALSVVQDDAKRLQTLLGSHDRQRLDEYFTSLRQLEQQIELSLSPPDLEECSRPQAPSGENLGTDLPQTLGTHRLLTDLLVFALLCDQTRVFNMLFSWGTSALRRPGESTSHHQLTHDEFVDPVLGYQPKATAFAVASIEAWAEFVRTLAATPEGAGSLLDNCLVLGHSESSFAKSHDVTGLPIMLAGRAGGAVQPGRHVRGNGEPVTRIGLTLQQIFGVPVEGWGTRSMAVTRTISEILA